MGFDEKLFGYFYQTLQTWLGSGSSQNSLHTVQLEPLTKRLSVLATLISGTPMIVCPSDSEILVQGNRIFLPSQVTVTESLESNLAYYLLYTTTCAWLSSRTKPLPDILIDYPGIALWIQKVEDGISQKQGKPFLFFEQPLPSVNGILLNSLSSAPDSIRSPSVQSQSTEKEGKTSYRPQRVQLNQKEQNPAVHVFEKVHTADEYTGGNRSKDGDDELDDHSDALNELNLSQVVRSNTTTASIYRSNAVIESDAPLEDNPNHEADTPKIIYPEWSYKDGRYLQNWCTIIQQTVDPISTSPKLSTMFPKNRALALSLRKKLDELVNQKKIQKRQREGDELDLEALIDNEVQRQMKHTPSDRIWQKAQPKVRDLSTLLLLDQSLSTDAWIRDERVLDVLKDAMSILSLAFEGGPSPVAAASFYSHTRNQCYYSMLKEFDDPWSLLPKRLATVEPKGYTRMGPALRHSLHLLKEQSAKHKIIILLSDAKPSDYDPYEGVYGISDVRRTVLEGKALNTQIFALTLSDRKSRYFNDMFGPGHFQYLSSAADLCTTVYEIYSKLVRSRS